jgi:S1-C subfamily serine protease
MKYICIKICLVIAALFGGVAGASDLPDCPKNVWHNCFGSQIMSNGDKYIGEFKDGRRNGQGTYYYDEGVYYAGEFKNGKFNGQGTTYYTDGKMKQGIWKDGNFQYAKTPNALKKPTRVAGVTNLPDCPKNTWHNCFGTFNYANGKIYVGEFKDGRRNGQGTYYYDEGAYYVGEFKNGKFNGQGTTYFTDGKVEVGIWKDGNLQYVKTPKKPVPVVKKPTKPAPVVKEPIQEDQTLPASSGSGFAVSSDGYVITNHHVIEGCQDVIIHTSLKDIKMRVIANDPKNDLALLKGNFSPLAVFSLSTERPKILQDIYVAGYPFGYKVSSSVKVTKGIISSLTGIGNDFSNIQIDAALQSGNSGGPILDDMGNVVGVAVAKLDAMKMLKDTGSLPENTNFGIKSSVVRSVLDSSSVDIPSANTSAISKSQLGKMITDGTYYISCWMTLAQIEKVRSKKVLFSELD